MVRIILGAIAIVTVLSGLIAHAQPPAVTVDRGELVSPADAAQFYGSGMTHTNRLCELAPAEGFCDPDYRSDYIITLSETLRANGTSDAEYIKHVFEYVQANIDTEFRFGLSKGAFGALLDQSGTPFDQAQLMVELLREGGVAASYQYGLISLNQEQFGKWTGHVYNLDEANQTFSVDAGAACHLLADGGIPATVNGSNAADCAISGNLTTLQMQHVWVRVGTTDYDPSFKEHTLYNGVDNFTSIMGCGTSCDEFAIDNALSGKVHTDSIGTYAQDVDEDTLGHFLGIRAGLVENYLQANKLAATTEQTVGGAQYDPIVNAALMKATSLPYTASGAVQWNEVPDQFRVTYGVELGHLALRGPNALFVDEVYGNHLYLRVFLDFAANDTVQHLRLRRYKSNPLTLESTNTPQPITKFEESLLQTAPITDNAGSNLLIDFDAPYAASQGAYGDGSYNRSDYPARSVHLVLQVGNIGEGHLSHANLLSSVNNGSDAFGDQGHWIGGSYRRLTEWGVQSRLALNISDGLANVKTTSHHSIGAAFRPAGTVSGVAEFFGVTISVTTPPSIMDVESHLSVTGLQSSEPNRRSSIFTNSLLMNAFEGSVTEQEGSSYQSGSVPSLMSLINSQSKKIYSISPGSHGAFLGGTSNYNADELDLLNSYFNDPTATYAVIAPLDGDTGTFGTTSGVVLGHVPFLAYTTDGSHTAFMNSDGFKGAISGASNVSEAQARSISREALDNYDVIDFNVDLERGDLGLSVSPLLSVGSGDFPYSLTSSLQISSSGPRRSPEVLLVGGSENGSIPGTYGWLHNFSYSASISSNGMSALGESGIVNAARLISVTAQLHELYGQESFERQLTAIFAADWLTDQFHGNTITVSMGPDIQTFIKRMDGVYRSHDNRPGEITITSEPPTESVSQFGFQFRYSSLRFDYKMADGSVLNFVPVASQYDEFVNAGTVVLSDPVFNNILVGGGFLPETWDFPTGVEVRFEYDAYAIFSDPLSSNPTGLATQLSRVSNNLNRQLIFDFADTSLFGDGGLPRFTVSDGLGRSTTAAVDRIDFADGRFQKFAYYGVFNGTTLQNGEPAISGGPLQHVFDGSADGAPFLSFEYDRLGGIRTITNKRNQVTEFFAAKVSDERYARAVTNDALGFQSQTYFDDRGNSAYSVSPRGVQIWGRFDHLGRQIETRVSDASGSFDAYEARMTYSYDAFSNVIAERSHSRTVDVTGPSANGQVALAPDSSPPLVTTRTYGVPGFPNRLSTETDARGDVVIENQYFPVTGLLKEARGLGGQKSTFTYNQFGQMETRTLLLNAQGETFVTEYGYDPLTGDRTSMTDDPDGHHHRTTMLYDAVGNVRSITGPDGDTITASHDAMRRMKDIRYPNNGGFDYEYDDRGLLKFADEITESGFARSTITYSPTARPQTIVQPSQDVITYTYNGRDELETKIDPDGLVTKTNYYPDGLIESIEQGVGTALQQTEVRFWYDALSNRVRHRPARGNRLGANPVDEEQAIYDTQYLTDPFGRAIQTIFPDGTEELLDLRADGLTKRRYIRQPNDVPLSARDYIEYSFDVSKRVNGRHEFHGGSGGGIKREVDTLFDISGRVISESELNSSDADDNLTGPDEIVTYDYDVLGRIETETANGLTVSYGYDKRNNRTRIQWPDGYAVRYEFDNLNRLDKVIEDNSNLELASYTYDLRSRLETGTMLNGTTTSFGYNMDDELTDLDYQISNENGVAETLSWDHGYTPAGRLNSTSMLDAAHPSWVPEFARTVSYGTANVLDQYVSVSDRGTLSYDARGNLIGDSQRTYTLDLMNRLVGASVTGSIIRYDYDVSGRRVGKDVDGVKTRYLHAGDMEIAEYSEDGTLQRRFIPGGVIDSRVAIIEISADGTESYNYYHADRLGNVAALTDENGHATDRYAYDPFGNEVNSTNASGNPFRYTGRRFDPETGLYYYRARYYDADLGRFLQADPVGYEDQWNLYAYVANDPFSATDPSGAFRQGTGWRNWFGFNLQWKAFDRKQNQAADQFENAANKLTEAADELSSLQPGDTLSQDSQDTIDKFQSVMKGTATEANLRSTATALNDTAGQLRGDTIPADNLPSSNFRTRDVPAHFDTRTNRLQFNRSHPNRFAVLQTIGHEAVHAAYPEWEHGTVPDPITGNPVIAYNNSGSTAFQQAFDNLPFPDTLRNPDHLVLFVEMVN